MTKYERRQSRVIKQFSELGIEALLVSSVPNVTYLTGFTGDSSTLLLSARERLLITDARYDIQLRDECPDLALHVRPTSTGMAEATAKAVQKCKLSRVGIEGDTLTHSAFTQLSAQMERVELRNTSGVVEKLRAVKDADEIEEIREAIRIAERAFLAMRALLRPDQTEKQVAADIEYHIRALGGGGCSFPPIVGVGSQSALAHGQPSARRIDEAEFVLIDWGAVARLYRSDLTRVLATSKISPKLQKVYEVVLRAERAAIAAIRPGVTGRVVDAVARGVIADAGHGKHFGHSLGHGIGLVVHELPRLSPTSEEPLAAGMVVTVEPGIYLPGWGGVRLEDDVLVTKTGCEVLSSLPVDLESQVVA